MRLGTGKGVTWFGCLVGGEGVPLGEAGCSDGLQMGGVVCFGGCHDGRLMVVVWQMADCYIYSFGERENGRLEVSKGG